MLMIHLNRVRQYALLQARSQGRKRFTRVGKQFYDDLEDYIRIGIADAVHRHASNGHTLRDGPIPRKKGD